MNKTALALIFLIVFIDLLGFGIIIPILPSFAQGHFGASDVTVGLLVASFSFMQLLFTPVWGRLSDRFGRKPLLLAGLFLTIVGYVCFGFAHTLALLFVSRLLSGIGGANISAAMAYIADVTTPQERAKGMGLLGAAFGLGFVFGPVMGGELSRYGYEVPGFAAAGLSTVSFILTMVLLPESRRPNQAQPVPASFSFEKLWVTLTRSRVSILLLLFFLITFAYANIFATFPIVSRTVYGYSDAMIGYFFSALGLISALTQGFFIRVLVKRVPEKTLFLVGSILTMLGLTLIPFHGTTWILFVILAVLSIGTGLTTPTGLSLVSKRATPEEQGGLMGINQGTGALARVLGPIWGGFAFQTFGPVWPFLTGGVVMCIVVILIWEWL